MAWRRCNRSGFSASPPGLSQGAFPKEVILHVRFLRFRSGAAVTCSETYRAARRAPQYKSWRRRRSSLRNDKADRTEKHSATLKQTPQLASQSDVKQFPKLPRRSSKRLPKSILRVLPVFSQTNLFRNVQICRGKKKYAVTFLPVLHQKAYKRTKENRRRPHDRPQFSFSLCTGRPSQNVEPDLQKTPLLSLHETQNPLENLPSPGKF